MRDGRLVSARNTGLDGVQQGRGDRWSMHRHYGGRGERLEPPLGQFEMRHAFFRLRDLPNKATAKPVLCFHSRGRAHSTRLRPDRTPQEVGG